MRQLGKYLKIYLLGSFGALVLRGLSCTWRLEESSREELLRVAKFVGQSGSAQPEEVIFAFWHNKQLMMPFLARHYRRLGGDRRAITVMISQHGDGRIIAWAVRLLGLKSVAGSSSKGGSQALRALVNLLEKGEHVAITPDGPRGPVYTAKPGVVKLAQISSSPILPLGVSADRVWRFGSWDKMELPKPFATVQFRVGEPINVLQDLLPEQVNTERNRVEEALLKVSGLSRV